MTWLEQHATRATRDGMARYGLPSEKALGVPMVAIQKLGEQLGKNHALAAALWETDCYEARLLAAYVGEPDRLTSSQMESGCRTFDNWGVCDTMCFVLFDRTPKSWPKVASWSRQKSELVRRTGFALLACLALHDRSASDDRFLEHLPLIEEGAQDERNLVKKGVLWALRAIGGRNPVLQAAAIEVAQRLANQEESAPRWVGTTALRELKSSATQRRLDAQAKRKKGSGAAERKRVAKVSSA